MNDTTEGSGINKSEELDVGSERFNPLRALYATDYRVTEKIPRNLYQNMAAFESALIKVGVWQLNKRKQTNSIEEKTNKNVKVSNITAGPANTRRFEAHQMPIEGAKSQKHLRNLYTHMARADGPLAYLHKYLTVSEKLPKTRIRVYIRKEHGIGGSIEGDLTAYDKQWNLLLKNAVHIWQRRKYKYGEQNICSSFAEEECGARLRQLGIVLPIVHAKSLNRKNVQLRRELPQLMIRGENVVLITFITNTKD